jgi:NADH-quinone oxidoreductase subunit E
MADASSPLLSAQARALIDQETAKYPQDRRGSAAMSALRIAQEEKGWLAPETIEYVASYLGIPAIRAFEVASFYGMFDLRPVGKYKLCLCTNLPCALSGAEETAAALKKELGINFGETTADGLFTLQEGECFGACVEAPVVIINNRKMCGNITPAKAAAFIQSLKNQDAPLFAAAPAESNANGDEQEREEF